MISDRDVNQLQLFRSLSLKRQWNVGDCRRYKHPNMCKVVAIRTIAFIDAIQLSIILTDVPDFLISSTNQTNSYLIRTDPVSMKTSMSYFYQRYLVNENHFINGPTRRTWPFDF